jgi:hypothetical protein
MPTTSAAVQHSRARRIARLLALLLFVAGSVVGPVAHAGHTAVQGDSVGLLAGQGDLPGDAEPSDHHHDAEHSPDACAVCLAFAGVTLPVPVNAPASTSLQHTPSLEPSASLLSVRAPENRRARAPPIV